MKVREVFTTTEKASTTTRIFSWLKVPTSSALMIFASLTQFNNAFMWVNTCCVKALVGTFNQEEALVEAFFVIHEGLFPALVNTIQPSLDITGTGDIYAGLFYDGSANTPSLQ